MTVSEITTAMVSEKPHDWRSNESTNLPTFAPNKISSRLEAKNKMRLSVQMARMRAKLPDEEKQLPPLTISKSVDNGNSKPGDPAEKSEKLNDVPTPLTPPAPCNACMPLESREYVNNLLKTESDSDDETIEIPKKASKPTKRVCGWDSSANLLCKKPATAADNRSLNTAKAFQRRAALSNNFAADVKVKINLYDRYTANPAAESFKFFHYSDLRLYIKQYRRNHSCGLGNRHHVTNVSPIYDANLQRYDYGYERVRSYLKSKDGFMLGLNSSHAHPPIWKANSPITSTLHQKLVKERRQSQQQQQVVEEPILSPRVFVSQNLAFSHMWKTKEDGTPDPYIAVTRPPTTQASPRPTPTKEAHKENPWTKTPSPTKSSPGHDSPGDLSRETPTWRIMQMIASCSRHPSRTDGSSSTTTNDFKSKTSDTDSNRDQEKSPDTGGTLSSSTSPDDTSKSPIIDHNNRMSNLKKKYGLLSNIQAVSGDRPVVYNNTRSILSNMSNLLTYYIETEAETEKSPRQLEGNMSYPVHNDKTSEKDIIKDAENRKQLLLLRKELKNIASRRSPSRQNFPSSAELAKVGSLVLPSHRNSDLDPPRRCNTSLQSKPHRSANDRRRKLSPSPVKSGYSGYKKVLSMAEQKEGDDKPILFVKRSQLLPTVVSSVESMKSKQVLLHSRNFQPAHSRHPADTKPFTKITDLLKNNGVSRTLPNTASGGRRIIHTGFSKGYTEPIRSVHSSHSRRK